MICSNQLGADMRGRWPRATCLRGLLLVTGGWVLTVLLCVFIIEQQQNSIEVNNVQEHQEAGCKCSCEHQHIVPAETMLENQNSDKDTRSTPGHDLVEHHIIHIGNVDNRSVVRKMWTNNIQANVSNGVQIDFSQPQAWDRIWPLPNETEDRVLAQMNLVPDVGKSVVKIVLLGKFPGIDLGRSQFVKDDCPVRNCDISTGSHKSADVIVFKRDRTSNIQGQIKPEQIVMYYSLESPWNTPALKHNVVNWTATYRQDSTLNSPYEKFTFYKNVTTLPSAAKDYATGKTKLAAWFVSNCHVNSGREKYVKELQKYMTVDIYGNCGPLKCARRSKYCEQMLSRDYKFYLAFENSNCVDYITEKFYWNGLLNNVVPVVLGARPEDYAKVAPPNSYIHVDDFETPRDLAHYLTELNEDNEKYNEYFRWKGTGEFINTKFWCRLCALAHEAKITDTRLHYQDFNKWWHGQGVCLKADNRTGWASWRTKPTAARMRNQSEPAYPAP